MGRKDHIKTIMLKTAAILLAASGSVAAMDVSTYFAVDLKSMEISIEGSKKVLACLQSGCPLQEQYALDDEIQQNLRELFESVKSTPSQHALFYMKHQKEIQARYDANETLRQRYDSLKKELESINSAIKSAREEQQ